MKKVHTLNVASTDEFVPVDEAAEILELKPSVIRNYLCDGRLTTFKFHSFTLLSREELAAYKKNHGSRFSK